MLIVALTTSEPLPNGANDAAAGRGSRLEDECDIPPHVLEKTMAPHEATRPSQRQREPGRRRRHCNRKPNARKHTSAEGSRSGGRSNALSADALARLNKENTGQIDGRDEQRDRERDRERRMREREHPDERERRRSRRESSARTAQGDEYCEDDGRCDEPKNRRKRRKGR